MISVHFQDKPFSITVIKSTTPNTNAEGAESDWFYKDLQELLELNQKKKKKKDAFFIIGNWSAKLGSQEIPGDTPR